MELGAINHYRHFGNIGFGGGQVQKFLHRLFAIQHAFIHVNVNNLRTTFNLVGSTLACFVAVSALLAHGLARTARDSARQRKMLEAYFSPAIARQILESGTDIRTVQNLLGHVDVATTQIYTHVMARPGLGVRSPLDL